MNNPPFSSFEIEQQAYSGRIMLDLYPQRSEDRSAEELPKKSLANN
jgi:hypothetical protein